MGLTHLTPGDGVWELRLSCSDPDTGRYTIALYDPKVWTQAGPFPLRFPSASEALHWFNQLTIEGTRDPGDDDEAKQHMNTSFISAKGQSATWGPMVSALFHADHQGPFLASPWWYGGEAPYVEDNPTHPQTQLDAETLSLLIQVFVTIENHRIVAVRKQTGDANADVQFMWWNDGRFTPEEPAVVQGGKQFLIYHAHIDYAEHLGYLAQESAPFPECVSEVFITAPKHEVSILDFPYETREYAEELVDALADYREPSNLEYVRDNLKTWLTNGTTVRADDLASWFAACMSLVHGYEELMQRHSEIKVDAPTINPQDLIGTERLIKFVAALIALTDDVVVIEVKTERYPDGVYVQLCREDDGALTIEAVSNRYLTPPLTPDEITALHALGWEDPYDEDLPNYVRYLEPEQTSPGEVAVFLVRTLQLVYGTKPSDLHQFAPVTLVRTLLKGEHGSEFAMNPNLSQAQKARLFLGLRFPEDLDPVVG
jgi:hypothetical protein